MTIVAVCQRTSVLALAVISNGRVLDVYRYRLSGVSSPERIASLVARAMTDYEAKAIVAEPGSTVGRALMASGQPFQPNLLSGARKRLLPGPGPARNQRLYDLMVKAHPELRRFVRIDPGTQSVRAAVRWRTVPLLAAALGLDAVAAAPAPQITNNLYPN